MKKLIGEPNTSLALAQALENTLAMERALAKRDENAYMTLMAESQAVLDIRAAVKEMAQQAAQTCNASLGQLSGCIAGIGRVASQAFSLIFLQQR